MIEKRTSNSRGSTNIGWLDSRHSFSFGSYQDPERTQWGALRVLNDDWVAEGKGFGTHPHRNAEIVSYVLEGELEHRDSMGNGGTIMPGSFQYMSAGRGVTHSEFNPSKENRAHFIQIWILPNQLDTEPHYTEFKSIPKATGMQLVASGDGTVDPPIAWHADSELYRGQLETGSVLELPLNRNRAFLHITRGRFSVGEHQLEPGDALAIADEPSVSVEAAEAGEFLWFDLD